jgi:hypothetical protein
LEKGRGYDSSKGHKPYNKGSDRSEQEANFNLEVPKE